MKQSYWLALMVLGLALCETLAGPALADEFIFGQACPQAGRSMAYKIDSPDFRMQGPDALGRSGDYLLINNRAAFVVSGLEQINTYYYYGGILIDAVALEGCRQANPEQFEELGFFVGELDPAHLRSIGIRAFRGERVEILSDGSDGSDAVVRVHGSDDVFWIVEYEFMRLALRELGLPKARTRPLGVDLYVDYILPADSAVLRMELNLVNRGNKRKSIFTAAGGFFGDATVNRFYSARKLNILGFTADTGLPYLVSSGGQGAWALGMQDANMGTLNLSGFDAFFDTKLLKHRIILRAAGKPGDSAKVVHYFAVGDSDFNSALQNLNRVNSSPIKNWDMQLVPLSGSVSDIVTGEPIPGVKVEIEMQNRKGLWKFIDGFHSDEQGRFNGMIPNLGRQYRAVAELKGRPAPEPLYFQPGRASDLEITFSPGGTLSYTVKDQNGLALPARIELYHDGLPAHTIYSHSGKGLEAVAPGEYELSVLRGYEYIPHEGRVIIEAGKTAQLNAVLVHALDTQGFMSADLHIHAGPSGDNKITIPERITTVAAEGLEVAVSTDHEAIIPWQPAVEQTGLGEWVAVVTGEEVTATVPEHINMFPVEPRFDLDARGGPIKWHGLDIKQVYSAIRERDAGIVQLNHPRNGCGYLCLIDYNRKTGRPKLKHPEYLGLKPDAALWSWDFDTVELQNGNAPVFMDPRKPKATGMFEDWMSFINHGHRVTAVADSDAHDWGLPGSPRNYFESSTDQPAQFDEDEMVQALKQGRTLTSTGAFARVELDHSAGMGDTLAITGDTVELWLHIESIPQIDITHFKVFVNCDQQIHINIPPTRKVVKYDGKLELEISGDSQIVVMGFGSELLPRGMSQFDPLGVPRFTTNPIYVDHRADGWQPPGWDGCRYTLP